MCLELSWKHGIVLGTCSGVIILEDAELWDMDAIDMKRHLCAARRLLPYVYDIEVLHWYQDNDAGRMQLPPYETIPRLLQAIKRIPDNPWPSMINVDLATHLEPLLEEWLYPRGHRGKVQQRQSQNGYVYLLAGGPYYKIGCAENVDRRIAQIQPQMPFVANLICAIATHDMRGLEAKLHRRFAERRTNGEWFTLDQADVEYIKGLAGADCQG